MDDSAQTHYVQTKMLGQNVTVEMLALQVTQLTSALSERDATIQHLRLELENAKRKHDAKMLECMETALKLQILERNCTDSVTSLPVTARSARPVQLGVTDSTAISVNKRQQCKKRRILPYGERQLNNFDFSHYRTHQVALHVIYLGWNMNGLVVQADDDGIDKSVERMLFDALEKTKLISSMSVNNNYSRCGRTDKGVSAFSQVLSIRLRGNKIDNSGVDPVDARSILPDYATILNAVLGKCGRNGSEPDGEFVRIAGYYPVANVISSSVERPFSARFDCIYRTYRYYFPNAHLDVAAMQDAADCLVGEHDFRNLCKLDYNTGAADDGTGKPLVRSHKPTTRFIKSAVIRHLISGADIDAVMFIEITGSAFLWHQIRCIMSILFLVGLRREQPDIVQTLLNCDAVAKKPAYCPASAFPLVLWNCQYSSRTLPALSNNEGEDANDTSTLLPMNDRALKSLLRDLYKLHMEYSVKAAMTQSMIQKLCVSKSANSTETLRCAMADGFVKSFLPSEGNAMSSNKYISLLKRK